MDLTYTVNADLTVTLFNEGTVFLTQIDDPSTEGFKPFSSKTKAEAWAKAASARLAEEALAQQLDSEKASLKAAEVLEKDLATLGYDGGFSDDAPVDVQAVDTPEAPSE